MDGHLHNLIKRRLNPSAVIESSATDSEERIVVDKKDLIEIIDFLKNDPDANMDILLDIIIFEHEANKLFEVSYILRSSKLEYRLCLSIFFNNTDLTLQSLTMLYDSADWLERELSDMFGAKAEGHPNLRKILMYPGFVGRPLRQDFEFRP